MTLKTIFSLLLVISMIFSLTATQVLKADAGTTAADFLKLSTHSSSTALRSSNLADISGTGALYYNPAAIGRGGNAEVSFSHSELFQDLQLSNVSIAIPIRNGNGIGFSVSYMGYGSIQGFNAQGLKTGELAAYSLSITLGASQRLTENLYLGINVKPVFEQLGDLSAQTVTFDLGFLADFNKISFAASYANISGKLKYNLEESELPEILRFGVSYRDFKSGSILSVSASSNGYSSFYLGSGVEYQYSSAISFRVGYGSNLSGNTSAMEGFSTGLGLNLNIATVDYAYYPSDVLGAVHQATLTFKFSK